MVNDPTRLVNHIEREVYISSLKEKIKHFSDSASKYRERIQLQRRAEFTAAGGCERCRGRGWVVKWDTLDSMSGCYAEYGFCNNEDCTYLTRQKTGLLRGCDTKYDHNKGTLTKIFNQTEQAHYDGLFDLITQGKNELNLIHETWKPAKDKLVRVIKQSRSYHASLETEGIVFFCGYTNSGASRVGIEDSAGCKHWTTPTSVIVVDPKPIIQTTKPVSKESAVHVVCEFICRNKSGKACAVKLKNGAQCWVPISIVPELADTSISKNTILSISVPIWLAEKNNMLDEMRS